MNKSNNKKIIEKNKNNGNQENKEYKNQKTKFGNTSKNKINTEKVFLSENIQN